MNKDAIKEYHQIMDSFEIIIDAMKWIQQEYDIYDFNTIVSISEVQLNNLRRFCINYIGDLEEC